MAETGCRIDAYRPPCGGCLNPPDERRWQVSVAGNRVLLCLRCVANFAADLQRVVERERTATGTTTEDA